MEQRNLTLIIFLILAVFSLTSCKEKPVETHDTVLEQPLPEKDSTQTKVKEVVHKSEPVREKLDESIIQLIREPFHKEYGKKARMEEKIEDDVLNITYYEIPSEENFYSEGYIISIYIPLDIAPDFKGDLNHDEKDDLIVGVGIAYGNVEQSNYYLFINQNDKYQFIDSYSNLEGNFPFSSSGKSIFSSKLRMKRIEDNLIIGEIDEYDEEDARCCPSIHYDVKMKFKNNDLEIIEKRGYFTKSKKMNRGSCLKSLNCQTGTCFWI